MSRAFGLSPGAGAPLDILPRGEGHPGGAQGSLSASRGFVLEVAVDNAAAFERGDDVILAGGPAGERVAVLARVLDAGEGVLRFKQMSPWRPVNTRAFERLPVRRPVQVRNANGDIVAGRTHDVSLGGLAVVVDERVADARVEIALGEGTTPWLPCGVVQADERDGAHILHLAFTEVGDGERACIAALVEQLGAELERSQAA